MTVCLDTGVFLQIFGRRQPFYPILRAMLDGRLTVAVSTEILFEYQEVISRLSSAERWRDVAALLNLLSQLHGNLRQIEPQFRFSIIKDDPDDNKFCDYAIAAEADYIVTEDQHFEPLKSAGYKPQPIKPEELIRRHLTY